MYNAIRVIRLTAQWCAPCKELAKQLQGSAIEPFIEVVDVGTLEGKGLCEDYQVRGVPTTVLLEFGRVKERVVGANNPEDIKSWSKYFIGD